jgi:hypothetical protein
MIFAVLAVFCSRFMADEAKNSTTDYADPAAAGRIWIGRNASMASCTACPPWPEVLWECEASSHRFSIKGLLPQKRHEDACALQKSRDCGTKHNGRKFAQARHSEFVLWRTAKTFIDSASQLPQRSSFFVPAFQLEHHALNVPVILVPTQELQALLRIAPL